MAVRVRQQDQIRIRIERLFWVVALCYFALVGRLVYLQAVRGEYYVGRAKKVRGQKIPLAATRGGLLDRTGRPLAVTIRTSQLVDRKSTRLNSSHSQISYAVFCL